MAARVARKKRDAPAFECAEHERVGRIAEWRLDAPFAHALEAGHGVKSAAADNADFGLRFTLLFFALALRFRGHVSCFVFVALHHPDACKIGMRQGPGFAPGRRVSLLQLAPR